MTVEELFRKYLDDNMTADELLHFREVAVRPENRAELDRLIALWIKQEFPSPQPEELDVDSLYFELTQNKHIPVASGSLANVGPRESLRPRARLEPARHSTRKIFFLSSVAAACLLLFALNFFLLGRDSTQKIPSPIVAKAKAPVITPAGDRAVLTLADGSHIILDSAANGELASQGNTQVVKLAGGQLAYRPGQAAGSGPGAGSGSAASFYNEIATPRGGFYQLILPDGSKVWLDAASSLRYPTAFAGKERSVELTGEAYFDIAPKTDQPFLITTQGMTVQVLGTEFNLMAYSDEDAIRTTLVTGSLRVVRGNDRQQIRPGEQASWSQGGNAWQLSNPDLREVLAWKQGEFRFQNLPIAAIMRQIARWYDVDIEFRGPQPASEFNGVISRKKAVTDLLTVLEQTDDVHFTLQGRKIIVEAGSRL
jgi:transmembrane sensor